MPVSDLLSWHSWGMQLSEGSVQKGKAQRSDATLISFNLIVSCLKILSSNRQKQSHNVL